MSSTPAPVVAATRTQRPKLTGQTLRSAKPESTPYDVRSEKVPGLLLRVEPSGTMTYWVQLARSKRRKLGNAKILTLDEATIKARQALADPEAYSRQTTRTGKLGDFIEKDYLPWRAARYPKTTDSAKDRLERNFKERFYNLRLDELTAAEVGRWITQRLQDGLAPASVEREVAELRSALSYAVAQKVLTDNPLRGLKHRRVDNTRNRFFSPEEEQRLRTALAQPGRPSHLAPMVLVSMNTGLRRGELSSLLVSDVDMLDKRLTVRAAAAKGKRPRTIPLNVEAHTALDLWLKSNPRQPHEPVFGILDVKKSFATLLRDANVEGFWWQALRHHFASRLVQRGVPLNTVRELMGHADLKMTLRYAALAPAHLADAVAMLGAL
jgi:site-specific recombinase XerD